MWIYLFLCNALLKGNTVSGPNLICGHTQTTSVHLPPERAAGTGIASLNDSPFVTLTLLCLIPHHSVPFRIFVHLCHGIWQLTACELNGIFPLMSLKDSAWLPDVRLLRSCVMWILTSAALCENGVSKWGITADWFFVMAKRKRKQANQLGPGWTKNGDFLPWETEKS